MYWFYFSCGLRCYTCTLTEPRSCTDTKSCPVIFNRCFSFRAEGYDVVTKGCQTSVACMGAMQCCEGDLCNSAINSKGQIASFLFYISKVILLMSCDGILI
uniref:UPAR/Ly6 domain-containing protein n=1 Tax=Neogobius melanostomus TaxID=47308 RepID=A0A8C6TCH6_9GOBI